MRKVGRFFLLPLMIAMSWSCTDVGVDVDHSDIPDPVARWQAYNYKDYSLRQTLNCFCGYGGVPMRVVVRDNRIADVVELSTGAPIPRNHWEFYRTVDGLFQLAASVNPDSVAQFILEHDKKYGFPSMLYIDYSGNVADEEIGYETHFISRE